MSVPNINRHALQYQTNIRNTDHIYSIKRLGSMWKKWKKWKTWKTKSLKKRLNNTSQELFPMRKIASLYFKAPRNVFGSFFLLHLL